MAPNLDREAEHLKEKARKDLLALLENVRASKPHQKWCRLT